MGAERDPPRVRLRMAPQIEPAPKPRPRGRRMTKRELAAIRTLFPAWKERHA